MRLTKPFISPLIPLVGFGWSPSRGSSVLSRGLCSQPVRKTHRNWKITHWYKTCLPNIRNNQENKILMFGLFLLKIDICFALMKHRYLRKKRTRKVYYRTNIPQTNTKHVHNCSLLEIPTPIWIKETWTLYECLSLRSPQTGIELFILKNIVHERCFEFFLYHQPLPNFLNETSAPTWSDTIVFFNLTKTMHFLIILLTLHVYGAC